MESESSRNKVDAIYELRGAVEAKAQAEFELAATGSAAARDALLEAQINVEAKTQDVIEVCHECGHNHAPDVAHGARIIAADSRDNVIAVDFRRDAEGA